MEIFLKVAYRMLESNVRFGEILHFLRRCLRPPTLEMSHQNMSSTSKVRVGYLGSCLYQSRLVTEPFSTVTAASPWTTDAEFTVKVKP
jgi:hypothetical protein